MMPVQDLAHLGHEFFELIDWNEILLQYVSRFLARGRLELENIIASLVISPLHTVATKHQGVDNVLANPLASGPLGDDREDKTVERVAPTLRSQASGHCH